MKTKELEYFARIQKQNTNEHTELMLAWISFIARMKGLQLAFSQARVFLWAQGLNEVPSSCMLQIMNKSGIASKRHLITGACVVDEGYTGEIFVNLHNIGTTPQFIEPGQKIAQGVFVRIEKPVLWVTEEDNLYGGETTRGSGALGSTGDK